MEPETLDDVIQQAKGEQEAKARGERSDLADQVAEAYGLEIVEDDDPESDASEDGDDVDQPEGKVEDLPSWAAQMIEQQKIMLGSLERRMEDLNGQLELQRSGAAQTPQQTKLLQQLEERWKTVDEETANNERLVLLRSYAMAEDQRKVAEQQIQQDQLRSTQEAADYEEAIAFIAAGHRIGDDKVSKFNVASKLTSDEIEYMRKYVRPEGFSMQQWADDQIKRRSEAKRVVRSTMKEISSQSQQPIPGSSNGARGTAGANSDQPTTIDEVIFLAREAQAKRRAAPLR